MSTREALIQKIQQQPEWIVDEVDRYLAYLAESLQPEKTKTNTWPPGYFEETAGVFANEPFERPPQLPFEKREKW
jgi:tetrahydromethanopterin S-methyltransferase subunit B